MALGYGFTRDARSVPSSDIQKIAVLRANGLGDFVFALPALETLKAAFPQAEVILLTKHLQARLLEGRPSPIDRVVIIPPARGVGSPEDAPEDPSEIGAFFARMQKEDFDLAVQMHGGGRYSNPFLKRLGAKRTLGLRTKDAYALDLWLPYVYFQPEVIRYLELVGLLGAKPVTLFPRLVLTPSDLEEAERVFPESAGPFILLHPGATDPRRRWPTEKFSHLGDALAMLGFSVLVNGVKEEKELTQAVIEGMKSPAIDLSDKAPLKALVGLLARSSLMIANDSGPLHLSAALETPSVGFYWCGNMITAGILSRKFHRPIISWQLECPVCGLDCTRFRCEHTESFVADISLDEVLDHVQELLSSLQTRGSGDGRKNFSGHTLLGRLESSNPCLKTRVKEGD